MFDRNLIIAVDVDDVCANLIGEWVRRYNHLYDDSVLPEAILGWNIADYLPKAPQESVYGILDAPDLYRHVLPIPGAKATVDALRLHGRVIFVTSCYAGRGADQKYAWLKQWGFLQAGTEFFAAQDKSLIRADYLLDDNIGNVKAFPGVGVLVSHTHNANAPLPQGIQRMAFPETLRLFA